MELSILLGKVIALYMIFEGLLLISRKKDIPLLLKEFKKNDKVLLTFGAIGIIAGLFMILNHNIWESDWRVIVTIVGWIALIKGLAAWFLPDMMVKWSGYWTNRNHIVTAAIVVLAIGLYLGYHAFGLAL
ncbi:hypothetical protein HOI83_00105 [Candidatus Uhrbacteria bacterium]|jgi:hypothetical protein|nr:hypothetical protein [Candidatus Uhrbacteria bacterium]